MKDILSLPLKTLKETEPGTFEPVAADAEEIVVPDDAVADCALKGGHAFVDGVCFRCGTADPRSMAPALDGDAKVRPIGVTFEIGDMSAVPIVDVVHPIHPLALTAPPPIAATSKPYQPRESPLEDDEDDTIPGRPLTWSIETLAGVESSLSRMRVLEMRKLQNAEIAHAAIARVSTWLKKQNEGIEWGIQLHVAKITEFAEKNRAEVLLGAKKGVKSRSLPSGRVGWRKKGGGYRVEDEAALLEWARTRPIEEGMVRIKEEPALDAIKKYAEANDLIPPGMTMEPAEDEFEVKPLKADLRTAPFTGDDAP